MQVFKFGGASVNSVERIQKAGTIIKQFHQHKTLVVISAIDKTTNELEAVVHNFYDGNRDIALSLFSAIKEKHNAIASALLQKPVPALLDFYTEVEWLLHDKPVRHFDYYYDQVVSIGEMLSTTIISTYLNETGINNQWIDVRDIIRTDNSFRDAVIDYRATIQQVHESVKPLFENTSLVITQGFVGATADNESTTLGREGSDFSAAIFANILDAEQLVIWKDVPGIMNADPKKFPEARLIEELNYTEVIEMAYFGAQVIHPKTIKPIQNKQIPLYVRSFINPEAAGTLIRKQTLKSLPPVIVLKEKQVLIQLRTIDFSFVSEEHVTTLYKLFQLHKIKPNLTQNTAISFLCVLDDKQEIIESLLLQAAQWFEVHIRKDLQLLTIRHYQQELLDDMTKNKSILLRQQTTETVQVLLEIQDGLVQ